MLLRAWARLALRRTRSSVSRLRPAPRPPALGPLTVDGHTLLLRPPRPSDAAAWCTVRLAERDHLRPGADAGGDWAASHTPLAWLERFTTLRRAERDGAQPYVVLLDGELVGECGVDATDLGTSTGELSIWLARHHGGGRVARAAVALVCLDVLTSTTSPLHRLVAPSRVDNPRAGAITRDLGFTCEATLTGLRTTSAGRGDYQLWVLHRCAESITALRASVRSVSAPAAG